MLGSESMGFWGWGWTRAWGVESARPCFGGAMKRFSGDSVWICGTSRDYGLILRPLFRKVIFLASTLICFVGQPPNTRPQYRIFKFTEGCFVLRAGVHSLVWISGVYEVEVECSHVLSPAQKRTY